MSGPYVELTTGVVAVRVDLESRIAAARQNAQLLDLLKREPAEGHTKRWQDERKAATGST